MTSFPSLILVLICFSQLVFGAQDLKHEVNQRVMKEAIDKGDLERVKSLLKSEDMDIDAPIESTYKSTPLMYAASCGRLEIMRYLMASRANVRVRDGSGNTVLHRFVSNLTVGQERAIIMVHALIKAGIDINAQGRDGETVLMNACRGNRPELFKALILFGADVSMRRRNGASVFMVAAEYNNVPAMELLLEQKVDPDATDNSGKNAFILAIEKQRNLVFNFFIQKMKVDIDQRDLFGATPLMWAVFYHNTFAIEKLLTLGANFNLKTTRPIRINVSKDMFMLSFNPQIEILHAGATALTIAYRYGSGEAVRLLYKAGARDEKK